MNILFTILIVIGGLIAMILLAALFMKKNHFVKREIMIDVPVMKAYEFLRLLEN